MRTSKELIVLYSLPTKKSNPFPRELSRPSDVKLCSSIDFVTWNWGEISSLSQVDVCVVFCVSGANHCRSKFLYKNVACVYMLPIHNVWYMMDDKCRLIASTCMGSIYIVGHHRKWSYCHRLVMEEVCIVWQCLQLTSCWGTKDKYPQCKWSAASDWKKNV